jgi:hypothetical protein
MNIKRLFVVVIFLSMLFPVVARCAIIEQRCFSDNFGDLYLLTGGKLGKKAYAVRANTVACGEDVAGMATLAKLSNNTYLMAMIIGRNISGSCIPFQVVASFDSLVINGNGFYDTFPRNSFPDGAITFAPISCSSVPKPNRDAKPTVTAGYPGSPQK